MARTRTLAELEEDVLWQADRQGTWLRNESAAVRRAINQSIAEFRELVSEGGHPYFLRATPGTLAVGPTAPYHFAVVSLAALNPAHHRVFGFDVKVADEWKALRVGSFHDRNDLQRLGNGTPELWFQFERNTVAYAPPAVTAMSYLIWDLPVHVDLAGDAETFDGLNGWEDWVVFNAVARVLLRDRDTHLERFQAERQRLLETILKNAPQRQRSGPMVRDGVQLERRRYRLPLQEA